MWLDLAAIFIRGEDKGCIIGVPPQAPVATSSCLLKASSEAALEWASAGARSTQPRAQHAWEAAAILPEGTGLLLRVLWRGLE